MSDEISEIRDRIDIVDLVGQTVALKRAGKNYKGLCPFHEDHNPSLYVTPEIGRYTCWSCKENGDIFTWVMKTQNVPFTDALQMLADKAGVKLRGRSDAQRSAKANQRAAMETALAFFREQLAKDSHALEYCEKRGLNEAIRNHWELGFAPTSARHLQFSCKEKDSDWPIASRSSW